MRRLWLVGVVVAALAPFALLAACDDNGGGGQLTLEEFFLELDAAEDAFREDQDEAQAGFEAIDENTPVEDVVALLEQIRDAADSFVASLEEIEPPSEAQAAHEETIAAFQAVSGVIDEAIGIGDSGGTADEMFARFDEPDAIEAETALDATCDALQSLADDNGIDVDLSCEL